MCSQFVISCIHFPSVLFKNKKQNQSFGIVRVYCTAGDNHIHIHKRVAKFKFMI